MPHTVLAFHAHPDDEALLTSGTMARAAAEGHRVILVVATDGAMGLTSEEYAKGGVAQTRWSELLASAEALGVARVETLGYADSGHGDELYPDPPDKVRFVRADLEEAAERLAAILREEDVDVLLSYEPNGGYGHRDHKRVHEVGARAAALAQTPRLLEATVPRDLISGAIKLIGKVYPFPAEFDPTSFDRAYSARSEITHRIDVQRYTRQKRASMGAHVSQTTGGGSMRTLAAFLRIPLPLYALVFGREWYVEPGATPGAPIRRDIFAGL